MDARRAFAATLASLPLVALLVVALPHQIVQFTDPCTTFGGAGSGSSTMTPDDACAAGRTSISSTREEAAATALALDGGIALAVGLAWAGAAKARAALFVAGSLVTLVVALPLLLGFGGLVVLPAVPLMLVGARLCGPLRGIPLVASRLVAGAFVAWVAFMLVAALAQGDAVAVWPVMLLFGIVAAAVAWAAFWPGAGEAARAAPPG